MISLLTTRKANKIASGTFVGTLSRVTVQREGMYLFTHSLTHRIITAYRTFFLYAGSAQEAEDWIKILRWKLVRSSTVQSSNMRFVESNNYC